MVTVKTYNLPETWSNYLNNNSSKGYSAAEIEAIETFKHTIGIKQQCVDVLRTNEFTYNHDAANVWACGCKVARFTFAK